ncbi:hypothetical protein KSF73_03305 [Burkholderiaceae bacterium DAT-1]|nr:hypothetical protein [Burkholderiaceae bacterium DAT-1]
MSQVLNKLYELQNNGQIDAAVEFAQLAHMRDTSGWEGQLAMAVISRMLRKNAVANQYLQPLMENYSDNPAVQLEWARLQVASGNFIDARRAYEFAVQYTSDVSLQSELGLTYMYLKEYDLARRCLLKAYPSYKKQYNVVQALATLYALDGNVSKVKKILSDMIEGDRTKSAWHTAYALMLAKCNMTNAALDAINVALSLDPRSVGTLQLMHQICMLKHRYELAMQASNKLLDIEKSAENYVRLSEAQGSAGLYEQGFESLARALELEPCNLRALSIRCFFLGYMDGIPKQRQYEMYCEYGKALENNVQTVEISDRKLDKDRPLRIGFVSGDLCDHPVSHWLIGIVENFDLQKYSLYFYSNNDAVDDYTRRYFAVTSNWRLVDRWSDQMLAQKILDDEIDILIDCSVHTGNNRLPVFAMRPARIQVSAFGSPNTTGLTRIDYRLTDEVVDPEGMTDQFSTEKIWRTKSIVGVLERKMYENVPVQDAPAEKNGFITFGSFNRSAKVNESTIEFWARVLLSLPNSRLRIILPEGKKRDEVLASFVRLGVDISRLDVIGLMSRVNYMEQLNTIDIHLDTFPYSGSTTTATAMSMGVPVLSIYSDITQSRASLTMMKAAGLDGWAFQTVDEALTKVREVAANPEQMGEFRRNFRESVRQSRLFDGEAAAREFEEALRAMWERYVEAETSDVGVR